MLGKDLRLAGRRPNPYHSMPAFLVHGKPAASQPSKACDEQLQFHFTFCLVLMGWGLSFSSFVLEILRNCFRSPWQEGKKSSVFRTTQETLAGVEGERKQAQIAAARVLLPWRGQVGAKATRCAELLQHGCSHLPFTLNADDSCWIQTSAPISLGTLLESLN